MYGKLYAHAYAGSMRGAGADAFAVWGWIIAHKDREGIVWANPREIADAIGMPMPNVHAAIQYLEAPDPDSHSKHAEGRRIIKIEGTEFVYHVVNAEAYAQIKTRDDLTKYHRRIYMGKYRDLSKGAAMGDSGKTQPAATGSTEAGGGDTEEGERGSKSPPPAWAEAEKILRDAFARLGLQAPAVFPRASLMQIEELVAIGKTPAEFAAAVEWCKKNWTDATMKRHLKPSAIFKAEKFDERASAGMSLIAAPAATKVSADVDEFLKGLPE